ncbi:hypothetical protein ICY_05164 [Bacillus cereus BAG2X1-3]|nr:hypothetical protein ICU_05036 [Bacillus cereus BAG2X1-1]EJS64339.1 hypothetical protein ICY_05164 [Bacillus cereus BAG2X1-3]
MKVNTKNTIDYKNLRNAKLKPTHFDQTFFKMCGFPLFINQYL